MTAEPLEGRTYPTPCGERRTYLRGCRCAACSLAHLRYCKAGKLRRQRGIPAHVPHWRFMAALTPWLEDGYALHAIADAAGIPESTIRYAVARETPVLRQTFDAVQNAAPEPDVALVDADLTRKRIRSLQRAGWSFEALRPHYAGANLAHGVWRTNDKVTARTAREVRALYRKLGDLPGPSPLASARAAARGYPQPVEWDDPGTLAWPARWEHDPAGDGETPAADVDDVAVRRFLAGDWKHPLNLDEKREAIRLAAAHDVSHARLMAVWNMSGTTFAKVRDGAPVKLRGPQERPATPGQG